MDSKFNLLVKKRRYKRIKGIAYRILAEYYDCSDYKAFLLYLEGATYPYLVYIDGVTKRFIMSSDNMYNALVSFRERVDYMLTPPMV